ncbi:hypothetical protein J437_LFUL019075 [Ladona fulva]|uniref:Sterol regulatory element-binding protein cleavage-activating protein n=1 Tax=Ladona fulva TaxID=123851 RepID=A0A8K0KRS8_LADFU|nr:hypothetical protein J437_LFUL019075 [Ladona fulva]
MIQIGVALAAVYTVLASLCMSVGLCFFFGLALSLDGDEKGSTRRDFYPYMVAVVGLENVLVLTRAAISTPPHLDTKIRIARALSREGWSITKNLLAEVTILTIGFFTFVPAIQPEVNRHEQVWHNQGTSLSHRHWPALLGMYNISVSGGYLSILPPIRVWIPVAPDQAMLLRHPEEKEGGGPGGQFQWQALAAALDPLDFSVPLTLEGHPQEVECMASDPSGGSVASCCLAGQLRVWDRATGELLVFVDRKGKGSFHTNEADSEQAYHQKKDHYSFITQSSYTSNPMMWSMPDLRPSININFGSNRSRGPPKDQQNSATNREQGYDFGQHYKNLYEEHCKSAFEEDDAEMDEEEAGELESLSVTVNQPRSNPIHKRSLAMKVPQRGQGLIQEGGHIMRRSTQEHGHWGMDKSPPNRSPLLSNAEGQSVGTISQNGSSDRLRIGSGAPPVWCIDFRDNLITLGCANGHMELWDGSTGKFKVFRLEDHLQMYTLHGHCGPITALFIDKMCPLLSGSGSQDGMLCVWDLVTGACMYSIQAHDGSICALTYSASYVISLGTDERLCVWERFQGHLLNTIHVCLFDDGSGVGITSVKIIGNRVVAAKLSGSIDFFELESYRKGKQMDWGFNSYHRRTHVRTGSAGSLDWDAVLQSDEDIRCVCIGTVRAHQQPITVLDSEGGRIITGSQDHTLKVFRLEDHLQMYTLHGHCGPITALFIDKMCPLLSGSGSQDGMLCVWDLVTGACMYSIQAHDGSICALTYSASYVISLGTDERLCVWERFQGHLLNTIHVSHTYCLSMVMLTHSLLITSKQGSLVVWDVRTGDPVRIVRLGNNDSCVFVKQILLLRDGGAGGWGGEAICDYGNQLRIVRFPMASTEKTD